MLKITGDINLTDGFFDTGIGTGSLIAKGEDPYKHIQRKDEDYWMGNMECVIADTSCQQGLKAKQFIISPSALEHIRHFDFYGLANNHVMQHGAEAYQDMCHYLEKKNVAYAGPNDKRCHRFTHQGKLVGVAVFNMRPENFSKHPLYWAMPEHQAIAQELESLKDCDYIIVYTHWGNEFINYPYIDQIQLAHFMIDCGAHLIIGMHPHVMQGCEKYKNGTIFYSLGNFVFNMPWLPTKYTIIVSVDLNDTPKVSYEYVKIGNDFFPCPVESVPEEFSIEHLNSLLNIREENEKYYKHVFARNAQYQKVNRKQILKNFMHMRFSDSYGILKEFVQRKIQK